MTKINPVLMQPTSAAQFTSSSHKSSARTQTDIPFFFEGLIASVKYILAQSKTGLAADIHAVSLFESGLYDADTVNETAMELQPAATARAIRTSAALTEAYNIGSKRLNLTGIFYVTAVELLAPIGWLAQSELPLSSQVSIFKDLHEVFDHALSAVAGIPEFWVIMSGNVAAITAPSHPLHASALVQQQRSLEACFDHVNPSQLARTINISAHNIVSLAGLDGLNNEAMQQLDNYYRGFLLIHKMDEWEDGIRFDATLAYNAPQGCLLSMTALAQCHMTLEDFMLDESKHDWLIGFFDSCENNFFEELPEGTVTINPDFRKLVRDLQQKFQTLTEAARPAPLELGSTEPKSPQPGS